ncbi:MAG: hypothetical protein ACYCZF_09810 [Anaerolineae bacterium]
MAKLQPRNTYLFGLVPVAILALVTGFFLVTEQLSSPLSPMRIMALAGYILTYTAILGIQFSKELVRFYGRMFIRIHHIMVVIALSFMVLHPVLGLVGGYPLSYLIPDLSSLYSALARSGPIALVLFAIASVAAVLRATIKHQWRPAHWLVYIAFLLSSIHAILRGTNLLTLVPRLVVGLMVLSVIVVFVIKRSPRTKLKG